jgi:hypothetical protein
MNATLAPTGWAQLLISAAASGLLGASVGGWIANHNQNKERRHRRYREQLGFYAELLSIRKLILAKTELRVKLSNAAHHGWKEEISQTGDNPSSPLRADLYARREDEYDRLENYSNKQVKEEIVPLYRKMLDYWIANMAQAEPSTQKHFTAFVEYVEIWNRFLQNSLPATVLKEITHKEKKLYPLYEDIEANVERLRKELLK